MARKILMRSDTTTNWGAANPVLGIGEIGYDTDVKQLKVGDGAKAWNSLSFIVVIDASTDLDGANASDSKVPSQLAVKTFVNSAISTAVSGIVDPLLFKGTIAGGATLPAADAGFVYKVSSAGTISTFICEVGDTFICTVDSTVADTPANWSLLQTNIDSNTVLSVSNAICKTTSISTDIDWNTALGYKTLSGAGATFTFSNAANGKSVSFVIVGDGSDRAVAWPVGIKWAGTSHTTVKANKSNFYSFIQINSVVYGTVISDMA